MLSSRFINKATTTIQSSSTQQQKGEKKGSLGPQHRYAQQKEKRKIQLSRNV
jgi:hypothetical protein